MPYKYVTEQQDYSDFASGQVFYSLPGHPAFPVRLASEIFQRCMALRETIYHAAGPCSLYDPCCGAAYHLSVLACLHGERIRAITASDVDEKAVGLANRNLALLAPNGMDRRMAEISTLIEQYGKDSHRAALASASTLKNALAVKQAVPVTVFQADATDPAAIGKNITPGSVDMVFTDVPYGQHSHWQGAGVFSNPLSAMLDALFAFLSPVSVLAIASDKGQKVSHPGYQRLEQFQIGKRRVVILKPGS